MKSHGGAGRDGGKAAQVRFIGRPQQIFWAMATFPHFAQRYPAILSSYRNQSRAPAPPGRGERWGLGAISGPPCR
jgi:hypothetical protein